MSQCGHACENFMATLLHLQTQEGFPLAAKVVRENAANTWVAPPINLSRACLINFVDKPSADSLLFKWQ